MAMTPTVLTIGILLGTATGGVVADAYGALAPLVVGASLAALALLSLVPELATQRRRDPVTQPDAPAEACPMAK